MEHPSDHLILRCATGAATPEEDFELDKHLAECTACVDRVRLMAFARAHFESLWGELNAEGVGRAGRDWRMISRIQSARVTESGLWEKVLEQVCLAGRRSCVLVKLLLDRTQLLAAFAPADLPLEWQMQPRLALEGVGHPSDDLIRQLARAREFLEKDAVAAAQAELESAARQSVEAPQAAVSEIRHGNDIVMEVAADSRRGTVAAKYWPESAVDPIRWIALIPESEMAHLQLAQFTNVQGEPYRWAEFNGVPSGPARLLFGM